MVKRSKGKFLKRRPPTMAQRLERLEQEHQNLIRVVGTLTAAVQRIEVEDSRVGVFKLRLEAVEKEQATAAWFRQELLMGMTAKMLATQNEKR